MEVLNSLINQPNSQISVNSGEITAGENAENSEGGDFLSFILNSAKEQGLSEEITEQILENSAKKTGAKSSKNESENGSLEMSFSEKSGETLLENAGFMELLSLANALKTGKFHKNELSTNHLNKMLLTEKNIKEIKGAKNLQDLVKIAQKFDLNLKNIKITKETASALKAKFSELDKNNFFDFKESEFLKFDPLTTKKIKSAFKNKEESSLNKLLAGIAGEKTAKNSNLNAKKVGNNEKSNLDLKSGGAAGNSATGSLNGSEKSGAAGLNTEISAAEKASKTAKNDLNLKNQKAEIETATNALKTALNLSDASVKPAKTAANAANQINSNLNEISKEFGLNLGGKSAEFSQIINENLSKKSNFKENKNSLDDYLKNIAKMALSEDFSKSPLNSNLSNLSEFESENLNSENGFEIQNESDAKQNASAIKDMISSAKMQSKNAQVRQVLDNFASDLQEKIKDYKPPITRFAMTLNPGNLGEVEVVMLNRGNNLHINFSSNNSTMQLFIQNQAEFKNSLVNMGFTELSMSFSDQKQGGEQQSRSHYRNGSFANENGDLSDELESSESQISAEIILPQYV